jgi:hypothetical protein
VVATNAEPANVPAPFRINDSRSIRLTLRSTFNHTAPGAVKRAGSLKPTRRNVYKIANEVLGNNR